MRTLAEENRAFLQDVALALPFQNYIGRFPLQQYEATLYLVMSDLYEYVSEVERERLCHQWSRDLTAIRASDLYAELKETVKEVVAGIVAAEEPDPKKWLEKSRGAARRKIMRVIAQNDGERGLVAATEILERDMPKESRRKTESTNTVVFFNQEDARLLEKALRVATPEPKLVGTGKAEEWKD